MHRFFAVILVALVLTAPAFAADPNPKVIRAEDAEIWRIHDGLDGLIADTRGLELRTNFRLTVFGHTVEKSKGVTSVSTETLDLTQGKIQQFGVELEGIRKRHSDYLAAVERTLAALRTRKADRVTFQLLENATRRVCFLNNTLNKITMWLFVASLDIISTRLDQLQRQSHGRH